MIREAIKDLNKWKDGKHRKFGELSELVAISTLAIGVRDYIGIIGDDFDGVTDAHEA
ncbi:hypothetical protein [Clostridium sp.]|jgi:hypothetical protein|uniref:hypothetical protein n=1 Tax=Clostridium sp. TaxID=1506 RepID=UPI003EE9AF5B